jgi:integrase
MKLQPEETTEGKHQMNVPADPIAAFCAEYHDYHDITEQRRRMQTRVLRDLEAHLPGPVLKIDADQLRAFAVMLVAERSFHPNTVRQYLNAIKPFLGWAWERRLISAEDLLEVRAVRPPRGASGRGKPHPYNANQLRRFWVQLEERYPWCRLGEPTQARGEMFLLRWQRGLSKWNRVEPYARRLQVEAIVALALYGGLRRDEIFNLRLEEMHPDNEYIVVRSRKNHAGEWVPRAVPWLSPEMKTAVGRWIEFREMLAPPHDGPWLSLYLDKHRLKPLRHRRFEMIVREIGEGWEYHRMRHTAATIMLRSGMELDKVSKILGHARLEQTREYVEVTHTDIVTAARRVVANFSRAFARDEAA